MLRSCRANRWGMVARAVVFLVLALIALDLWDASCDSTLVPQRNPTISSHASSAPDVCGRFCVPDCFCCSNPAPAVRVELTYQTAPLAQAPLLPVRHVAAGFLPVLDHVPLSIV